MMAKKASVGKAKKAKKESKGSNKFLAILALAAIVPFSLPTIIVLVAGLLPMFAAIISERGPHRYAWICVGGLNFAGLTPWLFDLWFGNHTMDFALDQILGVKMLLCAYSAAGAGWLLYMAIPPVVQTILKMTSGRRMERLTSKQKQLIEQWGNDVAK